MWQFDIDDILRVAEQRSVEELKNSATDQLLSQFKVSFSLWTSPFMHVIGLPNLVSAFCTVTTWRHHWIRDRLRKSLGCGELLEKGPGKTYCSWTTVVTHLTAFYSGWPGWAGIHSLTSHLCGYYTTCLINFFHFLRSSTSSLHICRVWQSFSVTPLQVGPPPGLTPFTL